MVEEATGEEEEEAAMEEEVAMEEVVVASEDEEASEEEEVEAMEAVAIPETTVTTEEAGEDEMIEIKMAMDNWIILLHNPLIATLFFLHHFSPSFVLSY